MHVTHTQHYKTIDYLDQGKLKINGLSILEDIL